MKKNNCSIDILAILPIGSKNAITSKKLSEIYGLNPRIIARAVNIARLEGKPVCSSANGIHGGYYIAENASELTQYLARHNHRAKKVEQTLCALQDTLAKMQRQTKMEAQPNE